MSDAVVGQLIIQLQADVARLQHDMDAAKHTVEKTMEGMTEATEKFKHVLETLGVGLSAMEFAEFINKTAEAGEQFHLLSIKMGIAIDDLVGLDLAARMNGGSIESFGMGVKKLSTYMFDATTGVQANKDMLHILGVTAKEPLPALEQIADQFAKMPDGADKSAVAVKLFGKTGLDMIPMLNKGSEAFREMIDEGKKLNPVAAEFSAKAVEFEDSMKKLQAASKGNAMIFVNELMPALTNTSDAILHSAHSAELFKDAGKAVSQVLIFTVEAVANTIFFFKDLGNTIGGVSAQIVAALHGDMTAVHNIQTQMESDHKAALDDLQKFKAEIENVNKVIADAPVAKTDNSVALKIKALADLRAEEAALAAQRKLESDAYVKSLVDKSNADLKEHEHYIKLLESYNPATKEMQRYQEELAAAAYYHTLSTSTTAEYNQMMEGIEQEHQAKMLQIGMTGQMTANQFEVQTMRTQIGIVAGILESSTSQAAQHNRVMFEINKQAKAANAVISTLSGINNALGEFPYPYNFVVAGIVGAAGFANVDAIESASFGGGSSGSAPSASGGAGSVPGQTANPNVVAAPATAQTTQPVSQFNLTLTGAKHPNDPVYTYNNVVNDLLPIIDKAYKNGHGNVNFNVMMA